MSAYFSRSVAFSPVGKYVLTGSRFETNLWNLNGKLKQPFKDFVEKYPLVAFSMMENRSLLEEVIKLQAFEFGWNTETNLLRAYY